MPCVVDEYGIAKLDVVICGKRFEGTNDSLSRRSIISQLRYLRRRDAEL